MPFQVSIFVVDLKVRMIDECVCFLNTLSHFVFFYEQVSMTDFRSMKKSPAKIVVNKFATFYQQIPMTRIIE